MGLLLVGVLAGVLIGFAWLAPSVDGPPTLSAKPPDPPTAQAKSQAKSQTKSQTKSQAKSETKSEGKSQAKSEAAQKAAEHSSARRHRPFALTKEATQPTRINVAASERRPAETPDPVLARAKVSIAAKMENPASVEFSDMDRAFRMNTFGRATDTICGHVRGRNASGGDTGERPFLYLVKEDDAYVVDGKPDSAAAIAYRNICN